jgi:pilus assembly protein CpaD
MIAPRRPEKTMLTRFAPLALITPALLLAGCETGAGVTQNRGLESVHQPVVSRTDYVFDMNTDNGGLAEGELQRLAGWMATMRLGYGDKVALDDPAGIGGNARADINAIVQRYGLFLAEQPAIGAAPSTPGTVRIVVSRTKASVPNCPDQSRSGSTNFDSHTSSNHGCAVNANLAAMVAQPEDLVRGQLGAVTSDPATGTRAIQALRRGTGSGGTGTTGGASGGGASTGGRSGSSSSGGGAGQ